MSCVSGGLYIAAGWDPFVLVEQGVSAAGRISGGSKPRRDKKLPESLDVFGWCTWDAFYSTVSAKGVAEGLKSLCDGGTPPKLLIIDDGWQVLLTHEDLCMLSFPYVQTVDLALMCCV